MLQVHVSTPAGQAAALDSRNKVDRVTMPLGKGLVTTFTVAEYSEIPLVQWGRMNVDGK